MKDHVTSPVDSDLLPSPSDYSPGLRCVTDEGLWYYADCGPVERQGWKLYVSFTPFNARIVLGRIIPVLVRYGIPFKYLRRLNDVNRLNSGILGYSQIGKCLVCYVAEANHALIRDLFAACSSLGDAAPAVPFARKIRDGIPMYYRYGAYRGSKLLIGGSMRADERGNYRQAVPEGIHDWLQDYAHPAPEDAGFRSFLLNYPAFCALHQQGKSGIFRALNIRSESYAEVILKIGYRNGALQRDGADGRTFLRNEIRVYTALRANNLDEVAPAVVDFFDDGERVALVLERIYGEDLLSLRLAGSLTPADVRQAWDILDRLHQAGFVVGDAKIGNFLRDRAGQVFILDFESGATPLQDPADQHKLQTFRVSTPEKCNDQVYDKLHFLTSVMFDYRQDGVSVNEARPVDLRSYLCDQPRDEIERWAGARISELLQ
ncbi:hypothetical protein [Streptomyces sp. NPDC001717]|uniref:class III lanthionine synthetase LanKC N-terminal domain-containing protein n=1 Tax=Streptomyces sp. NPDC001717 TaxID=3364604 RepID=UPI0036C492D6